MFLTVAVGIAAFLFSLALTPAVRAISGRLGLLDRPDEQRKWHAKPVPRLGGVSIAVSYLASVALLYLVPSHAGATAPSALQHLWQLLPAAGIIFVTGLADDLFGLRPRQKLLGQLVASAIAVWGGVQVQVFADSPWQLWWNIPLSMLWLVACTNAFNLIDGMDGLAAGIGLFATVTMLLAAVTHNSLDLALVSVPLVGCLLGFLRYNFSPASIFLGDSGSLFIGFLLGCFGTLWSEKSATMLGMTAPVMALSVPLADLGLAVARRFLRHQSIFGADRRHIHHRLADLGLSVRRVVIVIYAACGVTAVFSLLQNLAHNQFGGLIVLVFCGVAWIGIGQLGYIEFRVARQVLSDGMLRRFIDARTRLREAERALGDANTPESCWKALLACGRDFGFDSVVLSCGGRMFESVSSRSNAPSWRLRVALSGSDFIEYQRAFDARSDALLVEAFARAVCRALERNSLSNGALAVAEAAGRSSGDRITAWPAARAAVTDSSSRAAS